MNRVQVALSRAASASTRIMCRSGSIISCSTRAAGAAIPSTKALIPSHATRFMATNESSDDKIVYIHSTDEYIDQVQNANKLVAYYTAKYVAMFFVYNYCSL